MDGTAQPTPPDRDSGRGNVTGANPVPLIKRNTYIPVMHMYRYMEEHIGWIAGLIDGEGCFTFHITREGKKQVRTVPMFTIAMSPGVWESEVTSIFDEHDIRYNTREHQHISEVTVKGITNISKLCKLICAHSIVKRDLISRFINHTNRRNSTPGYTKTETEIRMIAEDVDFVRSFNKKRNVPHVWTGDKILSVYGLSNGDCQSGQMSRT